jgi:hypothetical protein
VSRAADEEAELTEATSATETQRRLQNERRTTVSGGGASWARSQSEREGKGARLSAQLSREGRVSVGGLEKARAHGVVAIKCAIVGASMTEGARDSGGFRRAGPTEQRQCDRTGD